MNKADIPLTLDGAAVLWVAPATDGKIGFDYETGEVVAVQYYAITQYAGDEPRAYLFAVSADHQVVGDYLLDSAEEAAQVAKDSGFVSSLFEPISP